MERALLIHMMIWTKEPVKSSLEAAPDGSLLDLTGKAAGDPESTQYWPE